MAANKIRQFFTWRHVKPYLLLTLGALLLAFGDAVFVTPFDLVVGGVISIGVIIQNFVGPAHSVVDIVTWIAQIILLLIGFLFVGKKFALKTLFSTLVYPLFFTLLYRVPIVQGLPLGQYLANQIIATSGEKAITTSLLIVASIFGGFFIGAGVSVSYYASGSSGGFDVLCVLSAKHTPIKEGVASLMIDTTLIVIGIFATQSLANGLIGVLHALVCAAVVQYSYVNASRFVIADILSCKTEEIQKYVHETMEHATTVIDVTGGYTNQPRKMLRVAFSKRELHSFRAFIGQVDPRAFVTFTTASMIRGEGFDPLVEGSTDPSLTETLVANRHKGQKRK